MARHAAGRRLIPRAPRRIPLDDEPLTPEDMRAIEEGRAAFARGDYCTLEEAKALADVRNAAIEVRKRLAQYYLDPEHAGELRIDLPIGSYMPSFTAEAHDRA